MKLYILGNTKTDKGEQLEKLTREILKSQGYNVAEKPEKSLGGFDIDVRASRGVEKLICECKAHKNRINTTDFLKFVGKIYVDNLKDKYTKGLIVALSGVNGNVQGLFDSMKKLESNLIRLIQGDDLINWLVLSHNIASENIVRQNVTTITDKYIKSTGLAYYESNVFWVVFFSDTTFTVLCNNAEDSARDEIIEYCKQEIERYTYVDLKKELYARNRKAILSRLIVEELISDSHSCCEITEAVSNILVDFANITSDSEVENAISEISIIKKLDCSKYSLRLDSVSNWGIFYKTILETHNFITPIFSNDKYLEHINEELFIYLLKDIGVFIKESNPEVFDNCIMAVRYSPLAFSYLLSEGVQYLINRPMPIYLKDTAYKGSSQVITRNIMDYFLFNIRIPAYADLYYNIYQLKSVERNNSYEIVVGENVLSFEYKAKQMLGKTDNLPGSPVMFVETINQ